MLYKQESLISFDHYKKNGVSPFCPLRCEERRQEKLRRPFNQGPEKKVVMQCPPLPKEKTQEQLHTIKQEIW